MSKFSDMTWYPKNQSSGQGLIACEITGKTIAVSYDSENTSLLAAAPKLAAALEELLAHCEGTNNAFYLSNRLGDLRNAFKGQKERMQAARAALLEARGQS